MKFTIKAKSNGATLFKDVDSSNKKYINITWIKYLVLFIISLGVKRLEYSLIFQISHYKYIKKGKIEVRFQKKI